MFISAFIRRTKAETTSLIRGGFIISLSGSNDVNAIDVNAIMEVIE